MLENNSSAPTLPFGVLVGGLIIYVIVLFLEVVHVQKNYFTKTRSGKET